MVASLISTLRAPKSSEGYKSIGGGSPLRRITQEQADALAASLQAKGVNASVYVGMRYWKPFTEEAINQVTYSRCPVQGHDAPSGGCRIENAGATPQRRCQGLLQLSCLHTFQPEQITQNAQSMYFSNVSTLYCPAATFQPCTALQVKEDGVTRLVVLPLYPQFSISTSASSLRLFEDMLQNDPELEVRLKTKAVCVCECRKNIQSKRWKSKLQVLASPVIVPLGVHGLKSLECFSWPLCLLIARLFVSCNNLVALPLALTASDWPCLWICPCLLPSPLAWRQILRLQQSLLLDFGSASTDWAGSCAGSEAHCHSLVVLEGRLPQRDGQSH